jgi:hypothetical protein
VNIFEGDAAHKGRRRPGVGDVFYGRLGGEQLDDALAGDEGFADLVYLPAQGPKGREEEPEVGHEDR